MTDPREIVVCWARVVQLAEITDNLTRAADVAAEVLLPRECGRAVFAHDGRAKVDDPSVKLLVVEGDDDIFAADVTVEDAVAVEPDDAFEDVADDVVEGAFAGDTAEVDIDTDRGDAEFGLVVGKV